MPQEIERKFLVTGEYKPQAYAHSRIVQGYISSVRGRTVRVRIRDERGFLTIKGASNESGTSRYEWEKEIPLCEARELLKLCEPGVIDKTCGRGGTLLGRRAFRETCIHRTGGDGRCPLL